MKNIQKIIGNSVLAVSIAGSGTLSGIGIHAGVSDGENAPAVPANLTGSELSEARQKREEALHEARMELYTGIAGAVATTAAVATAAMNRRAEQEDAEFEKAHGARLDPTQYRSLHGPVSRSPSAIIAEAKSRGNSPAGNWSEAGNIGPPSATPGHSVPQQHQTRIKHDDGSQAREQLDR